MREFRQTLAQAVTGSRFAIKFDYALPLRDLLLYHLKRDDIDSCIEVMRNYNLTPEAIRE